MRIWSLDVQHAHGCQRTASSTMTACRFLIRGCLTASTLLPLNTNAAVATAVLQAPAGFASRKSRPILPYPQVLVKTHIFAVRSPSSLLLLPHRPTGSPIILQTPFNQSTISYQSDSNNNNTMDTVKVAILDCDTAVPKVAAKYGRYYSSMFISRLQAALERSGSQRKFEFSAWKAMQSKFPDPSTINAIIITGGVGSAYDPDPWITNIKQYILDVFKNHPHIKIMGGCLGHQLVSQALLYDHGIHAEKNPQGGQFGIKTIELNPEFTSYFPEAAQDAKALRLQVIHNDHIHIPSGPLPQGWVAVGKADGCPSHGLFLPHRVLTLQSHFEFDEFTNYETIKNFLTRKAGYSQDYINAALENTKGTDDSEIAADVVLAFLTPESA